VWEDNECIAKLIKPRGLLTPHPAAYFITITLPYAYKLAVAILIVSTSRSLPTMAVNTDRLELAMLPVASVALLLRSRGSQIDRPQREHLLNQMHLVLATGLESSWVVDRLPEVTHMHPRCWGQAVLQNVSSEVLYFGGRDMSKFGADAHCTLLAWKCGEIENR
jgi:hypothetical protein